MDWKRIALSGAIAATLAAAPLANADAGWRRNPVAWPFVAGAAVVGTAAVIATAPVRAAAAAPYYYYPAYPYYAPGYYGYYAPGYYAPPAYSAGSPSYSTGY